MSTTKAPAKKATKKTASSKKSAAKTPAKHKPAVSSEKQTRAQQIRELKAGFNNKIVAPIKDFAGRYPSVVTCGAAGLGIGTAIMAGGVIANGAIVGLGALGGGAIVWRRIPDLDDAVKAYDKEESTLKKYLLRSPALAAAYAKAFLKKHPLILDIAAGFLAGNIIGLGTVTGLVAFVVASLGASALIDLQKATGDYSHLVTIKKASGQMAKAAG